MVDTISIKSSINNALGAKQCFLILFIYMKLMLNTNILFAAKNPHYF